MSRQLAALLALIMLLGACNQVSLHLCSAGALLCQHHMSSVILIWRPVEHISPCSAATSTQACHAYGNEPQTIILVVPGGSELPTVVNSSATEADAAALAGATTDGMKVITVPSGG